MNKLNIVIVILALVIVIAGCVGNAPGVIAGKGGKATLTLYPQHHGISKNIDTCKVYIKYNAVDQPVVYDDSATCICADSVAICTFQGLNNGRYYVYGYGYDSSINEHIKGGIPIAVSLQNTTTVIYLPVSED